ncbi:MAG: nucleotidyltransferase [Candidatus Electrothrix sp. EH2]|nr:nucleotidyltransferase [Candidatus Electrothrix sp. EH2]
MNITRQQEEKLKSLCRACNVKTLSVFGSVLRPDFNRDSDIDFIVDIDDADPLSYADKYFELKFALERLFGRAVDLLEEKSVRNPVLRRRIDETRALIYG